MLLPFRLQDRYWLYPWAAEHWQLTTQLTPEECEQRLRKAVRSEYWSLHPGHRAAGKVSPHGFVLKRTDKRLDFFALVAEGRVTRIDSATRIDVRIMPEHVEFTLGVIVFALLLFSFAFLLTYSIVPLVLSALTIVVPVITLWNAGSVATWLVEFIQDTLEAASVALPIRA